MAKKDKGSFIPGIFNYCDRWCEKCAFTSKCATYAATADVDLNDNEAVFKHVQENLQKAVELIYKKAQELGIDLDSLDEEEKQELKQERTNLRDEAEESPLGAAAQRYMDMVDEWLTEKKAFFEEKEKELNHQLQLGVNTKQNKQLELGINDAVEIIQYYRFTIYTKILRAVKGSMEPEFDVEGFPKDSDGSAKVALISMDNSMAAWARLQVILPELTDDFITFLLHLDRLRKATEKAFPNARSFVRPGFDERK